MKNSDQIVNDLMDKLSEDVRRAISRVLDIAPAPHLPIVMCAVAASVGAAGALLAEMAGPIPEKPDPECVMLAALIGARHAVKRETVDATSLAYEDLEILKIAGRL